MQHDDAYKDPEENLIRNNRRKAVFSGQTSWLGGERSELSFSRAESFCSDSQTNHTPTQN